MIGKTLSHYCLIEKIGEGGMGVVWRARDTKLDRDVAIKILPETFTSDPDRLARFEREAKVLASLNHPNIGHIYGLEENEGVKALVLELVEGPTLADRIRQGPIPLDEALPIARQIAEALGVAHENGIIHRDLKPANVKVKTDGTVKVLDFGLAKAFQQEGGNPDLSQSPTQAPETTQMGLILGTAAYMAPEQARGRPVDKRADVWAFGCVLYEMLSGKRPFAGEDLSETLARVIEREPAWEAFPVTTPPALVRVMQRCLRKNPKDRLHDIADARLEIEEVTAPGFSETTARNIETSALLRHAVPWGIAALMTMVAAATLYWDGRAREITDVTRAHLQIVLPDDLRLAVDTAHPTLALSPDGSRLVFVGDDGQTRRLYMRELAGKEARVIAGTEGAASPFFSPNGEWIGFFAGTNLMKVSSASGAPVAVHAMTPISVNRGATWVVDQTVVFAGSANSGLSLASVGGQEQRPIADLTDVTEERAHFSWPDALPGGRGVIFTDNSDESLDAARVALLSLESGNITRLNRSGTNPRFSPTGHILYARGGSLYAVRFDVQRKETTGAELMVLDGVMSDGNGSAQYAVGGNGTLAYVSGPRVAGEYELVWTDREGHSETLFESDQTLFGPRLSPDGSQVAVTILDGANSDVWLFDLGRRTMTRRLTTHPGEDFDPVWHPGGQQLVLGSEVASDKENRGPGIAWIRELGAPPEPLTRTPGFVNWEFPASFSPDGQLLAFVGMRDDPSGDILLLSMSDLGEPTAFLQTPADERAPMFSPDGRWMAYVSNDTGRDKVYVQPYPGPGRRTEISPRGGSEPLWAHDSRELFYRQGDHFMVTPVDGSGERFFADNPGILFHAPRSEMAGFGASSANYDVSLDGARFVMVRRKHPVTATVIDVVLNWQKTLPASSEAIR